MSHGDESSVTNREVVEYLLNMEMSLPKASRERMAKANTGYLRSLLKKMDCINPDFKSKDLK